MPKTENPKLRSAEDAQTAAAPPWSAAAPRSHIGGRSEQQDARQIYHNSDKGTMLIVVCDGVGGSRSGGEASTLVIKTAHQLWTERNGVLPNPQGDLLAMSRTAHERICELAATAEKRAPAATIVALYLTQNEAHWVHSGDSRLYRFRDGEFVSRTRDHSVVQILLEQGEITEGEMGNHPDQGRLLQALGTKDYREPSYGTSQAGPADTFLLCTDGFWERTPLRVMVDVLTGDSRSLETRLTKAIARAVFANGQEGDNVTAAAVVPIRGVHPASSPLKWLMPLIAVGLLVAAGAFYWIGSKPPITDAPITEGEIKQNPKLVSGVKSVITAPEDTIPAPAESKQEDDLGITFVSKFGIVFRRLTAGESTFYMAETELTESQWDLIENGGGGAKSEDADEGDHAAAQPGSKELNKLVNGNLPKCNVSPEDVLNWLETVNESEKVLDGAWRYRLPTVAEWIASARGPKGDNVYPWGKGDRPSDFGNWQAGNGTLLPVGSTNDHPAGWPFKDFVGNATEIITVPSGQTSDQAASTKQFARFGSSYQTPKAEFDDVRNLNLMASDNWKNWDLWIDAKEKHDNLGFRLVLGRCEEISKKPTSLPPVEQSATRDNPPKAQNSLPSNL
jgi:serine/threonine protein phosphatase PrpC